MFFFSMKCKDWSEDVSLIVGKRRLDGFEDVGNISLESCKAFLNQFEAGRAIFLQISDKFPNSSDVEFSKDVTENLENISPVTIHLARMVFPQMRGTPILDQKSLSET